MKTFRPGQIVSFEGQEYKIMATNHDGKLILAPRLQKETVTDMMYRLQSTVAEEPTARVEAPKEP